MNQFFTIDVLTVTVASGIALATPFLLAALGETIGQRSGVINLGVDGIMLLAAFATYYIALQTGDLFLAILAGAATGTIMGIVTALVSVTLKAEQGISGIGIYLFGLGFSALLFQKLVGTPLPIATLPPFSIPLLDQIPVVGGMFFKQSVLVYLAFLLVPVVAFVLNRTTYGLKIKAVGESRSHSMVHGDSRMYVRRSRRREPSPLRWHLPGEPDSERGVHRRRARLLRCVATGGRDGGIAAVRARRSRHPDVEIARDHSPQCVRSGFNGAGGHHRAGPAVHRPSVPTARRSWQTVREGGLTRRSAPHPVPPPRSDRQTQDPIKGDNDAKAP
jgi:hypothetical protein